MEKTVTIKCRDMIETLGLGNLSSEEKDDIIGQMSEVVSNKIILKVMERISEDEADELNEYFNAGDMEKVNKFLNEKVSNFSEIIQNELDSLQDEMVKKMVHE